MLIPRGSEHGMHAVHAAQNALPRLNAFNNTFALRNINAHARETNFSDYFSGTVPTVPAIARPLPQYLRF